MYIILKAQLFNVFSPFIFEMHVSWHLFDEIIQNLMKTITSCVHAAEGKQLMLLLFIFLEVDISRHAFDGITRNAYHNEVG